ncbi:RES family NAD+ phosphorylase [Paucibacter soli]|uniref:RES family NAD+ phosphorylase n=1 Tax=Paucibacter soli TaxID=3133433 RepID=UPI0030ADA8E5
MDLNEFEQSPAYLLPATTAVFRIQCSKPRPGTRRVGKLRLAPPGLMRGRFDLHDDLVGYFAMQPCTAAYEALARREKMWLSLAEVAKRELLCMRADAEIKLLDLRPHASSRPVLQSLRFGFTQDLAKQAAAAGYQGIIYLSAQQHGMECLAIFGAALKLMRFEWAEDLVSPETGALHKVVGEVCEGACLSLMP